MVMWHIMSRAVGHLDDNHRGYRSEFFTANQYITIYSVVYTKIQLQHSQQVSPRKRNERTDNSLIYYIVVT